MLIDAIISLGGLVIPPVFDFIKKKFIKTGKDTPEATMATLAVSKPEALAPYVEAMAGYLQAQVSYFNRDVIGTLPVWCSALRATIRPAVVIVGLLHFTLNGLYGVAVPLDDGVKYFYEANISSWFGARLSKD
jgi:hypothetical protein